MERNVLLLYMSMFKYPSDRPEVKTQTNEAAVRELQKYDEGPDCILALCSKAVRTVKSVHRDGTDYTTLEYFRDVFLPAAGIPAQRLLVIEVPDSMREADQAKALDQMLRQICPEDRLSVDLSGGLRDTAMLLVTAARCMRDLRGVETRRVIYSELQKDGSSKVHDSSKLYDLFDLVTAMDEFFSTGTAKKLNAYLSSEMRTEPTLRAPLAAINRFAEDLALCRVQALAEDLRQIGQALQNPPQQDQTLTGLFFQMLNERFRTEFAQLLHKPRQNLPALVRWCTGHGMYQQALTLLCEQMPEYVCRHLFVQPTPVGLDYMARQAQNKNRTWTYPLFHFHFCRLTLLQERGARTAPQLWLTPGTDDNELNLVIGIATPQEITDYLDTAQDYGLLVLDPAARPLLEEAVLDYQKVMQYRNQINHASDNTFGLQSNRILPLETAAIQQTLEETAELLQRIQPLRPVVPQGTTALAVDAELVP